MIAPKHATAYNPTHIHLHPNRSSRPFVIIYQHYSIKTLMMGRYTDLNTHIQAPKHISPSVAQGTDGDADGDGEVFALIRGTESH